MEKYKLDLKKIKVGQKIKFSGILYTVRDQAHKRLTESIRAHKKLPFNLNGAIIYYCGPTPAAKNKPIGSCGPTSSSRMDDFTPFLLKAGIRAMVGKGRRSSEVIKAIKKYKCVYFLAYAGCGALLSRYIRKAELVAYRDLGPEAIYKLEVKDFPLIVAVDSKGRDIYA